MRTNKRVTNQLLLPTLLHLVPHVEGCLLQDRTSCDA